MNPRLAQWIEQGVIVPAPDLVYIAPDVPQDAIQPGAVLHPFARIQGKRTLILEGAEVGTEGPASVKDCALGRKVRLASGHFEEAVMLTGASHGPSGHVRGGTIYEEGASAAHATGTKQTILLPWATLGSDVNFCDALLAGGSSEHDHSEVGSGFIHFNFTPYGPRGDKATASLFGTVPEGVFLRAPRIFLGGAGGVVGPIEIGFGTVLAAGSVYRRDRLGGRLVYGESLPPREVAFEPLLQKKVRIRFEKNLHYIGQLEALRAFYLGVRVPLASADPLESKLLMSALIQIDAARRERVKQLVRFLDGLSASIEALERAGGAGSQEALDQALLLAHGPALAEELARGLPESDLRSALAPLAPYLPTSGPTIAVVRALPEEAVALGIEGLRSVVQATLSRSPFAR